VTLTSHIHVKTQYTRSVKVERDNSAEGVVAGYIPTSRATHTLERVLASVGSETAPRAWSLTGPYGSGKSSFAIFLAHLLDRPASNAYKAAYKRLAEHDKSLAQSFCRHTAKSEGYCRVLLTGSPEPFGPRLVDALASAATDFWAGRKGSKPLVVKRLIEAANAGDLSTSKILDLVEQLRAAVKRSGGKGVLLIIDELGKFLEYEARHYGANDIYLLQALAESAYTGGSGQLLLFVLMHQGFEQYARALSDGLRDEWAKVQGRFENIAFLEQAEQVLRVVAAAIEQDLPKTSATRISKDVAKFTKILEKADALPPALSVKNAEALFRACYPLHPLTALVLPSLCQKVAQNERTLFNYLGSHEPKGFQDCLSKMSKLGGWIYPADVFDYFLVNQPAAFSDPMTHRRWAEVVTALERLGDASPDEMSVLRTIGLMNILGVQAGFKASRDIISMALPTAAKAKRASEALVEKSLIQYRRFSGEYRVWQGSDFDLDAATDQARAQLGRFDLPEAINVRSALGPIVARRYSIASGTLRCMYPVFTDARSFRRLVSNEVNPRMVLYIAESQDDVDVFKEDVTKYFSKQDIVALCPFGGQLRQAVGEALALERVQAERQELHSDPVARREFADRQEAARTAEAEAIARVLNQPGDSEWYWQAGLLRVASKADLQKQMSRVLEDVYSESPIFRTELLNRDNPSSTANAARNKLFAALLEKGDEEDLGIDKYPAEKGLYWALLKNTALHQKSKDGWKIRLPTPKRDRCRVRPVMTRIEAFLAVTEEGPRSFAELDPVLSAPPYGVKKGLLTSLYLVSVFLHRKELALYEDGSYVPELDPGLFERFVRRPETFQVQRFRVEGLRASVFREYSKALYGEVDGARSVLSIAKPLAKFVKDLPEYTKRTRSLSPGAQDVRNAITYSKSPERLVFEDLPRACGTDMGAADVSKQQFDGLAETLMSRLRELKYAYQGLLHDQQSMIARVLSAEDQTELGRLRSDLVGRYRGLDKFSMDADGLAAFIRRLTNNQGPETEWFDKLLMFLGRQPASKWTDADRTAAEVRLADFGRRLKDLERVRLSLEEPQSKQGDFDVLLLRTVRPSKSEHEEVIVLRQRSKLAIEEAAADLMSRLDEHQEELRLAVLGSLVDMYLDRNSNGQVSKRDLDQYRDRQEAENA